MGNSAVFCPWWSEDKLGCPCVSPVAVSMISIVLPKVKQEKTPLKIMMHNSRILHYFSAEGQAAFLVEKIGQRDTHSQKKHKYTEH